MKTLNSNKSEEIFYRIKQLASRLDCLSGVVQNPDFVNEDNAQENYLNFYNEYKSIKKTLDDIRDSVYELHHPLMINQ